MRQRILVIVNPRASRNETSLSHALARISSRAEIEVLESPCDDVEGARCAERMRASDRVVVAGGDGTLHAMLPLLLEVRPLIGVLPLGTANDFARSVGVPVDLDMACDVACGASSRDVDIALVNGRPFVNVASIGLAVTVTKLQTRERKKRWRVLSYAVSLVEAVRLIRPFRAQIALPDGGRLSGRFLQVSVGNGRYHGGGLSSGPEAEIDDGRLHIYAVAAGRWWQLLPVVPALAFGFHRWVRRVQTVDAHGCLVRTRTPKRVSVDGELSREMETEFQFAVQRGALRVLTAPADSPPASLTAPAAAPLMPRSAA